MKVCKSEVKKALQVAFNAEQHTFAELFAGVDVPFWYDGLRYVVPFKLDKQGCFCDVFDTLVNRAVQVIKDVNKVNK